MTVATIRFSVLLAICGCFSSGLLFQSACAQNLASRAEQPQVQENHEPRKPVAASTALAVSTVVPGAASETKSVRRQSAKGPYYVDFRARTAASYGHAFVWYGKTSEKVVEVAGLHPAGDVLPYVLGHIMGVPSETGASYGDLDVQYLTASYRVYLNEADAKRVFAFIKDIQAHSPLWNAETYNCTAFIGRIANFMGLKTPFHLQLPEDYVNNMKRINGNRQTAQLSVEQ